MEEGRGRALRALDYMWGGWGAASSLLLLTALWEAGHAAYGTLVLPSPRDTVASLWDMSAAGKVLPAILETSRNALGGFLSATVAGGILGGMAGASDMMRRLLQPIATLLLGIPAIAWVVLALLWFGGTGAAVSFTVLITTAPIVFAGAAQGARTLDGSLRRMARSFRVPATTLIRDVYLPHMLSYLFPALATGLALSWKVTVMAELLSGAGGIGDGLAVARVQVDTVKAMAWVLAVVGLLLAVEYLMLEPIRRHLQVWRREMPGSGDIQAGGF
ncbi:ABC transporter permease [Magnetospirillum sp. SS-4]|uniref:ABC transporter permease n=1 Tax=Magnetospirillum sp. SS-4 TaxID=2681465 RepID=UPI001380A2B1|nr:ABC transporter permease subunit [Magnetospirillum sp. SS-4]CAA7616220.1 Binding-protein-dependent transporters inner membrane component [Magnetospirillum sp. SS-4]